MTPANVRFYFWHHRLVKYLEDGPNRHNTTQFSLKKRKAIPTKMKSQKSKQGTFQRKIVQITNITYVNLLVFNQYTDFPWKGSALKVQFSVHHFSSF